MTKATPPLKKAEAMSRAALVGYYLIMVITVGIILFEVVTTRKMDNVFFTVAFAAFFVAITALLMGSQQMAMMYEEMRQAEELANRKDEALIAAIESLTAELKRRPAPDPSIVNFTLFGAKK